jgi:hypothetical protein
VLIGYMRVSKADGSQALDLQRDALLGTGIPAGQLYEDHASGKQDDRPGPRTDGEKLLRQAGKRKGLKPDGQPLQHDATKYGRHAATEVDFEK